MSAGLLALSLLLTPASSAATAVGPAEAQPEEDEAVAAETTEASVATKTAQTPVTDEAIFLHYRSHAADMRRARFGAGIGLSITGGAAVATAATLLEEDGFARGYLLLAGGTALVGGVGSLVFPSTAERTALEFDVEAPAHSRADAERLRERWGSEARAARTLRFVLGIGLMALGTANASLGIVALAVDDPTFTEPERGNLATFCLVSGALFMGGGSALLAIPSRPERSFADFEAAHPPRPQPGSVGFFVAPLEGGAAVGLGMSL